MAYFTDNEAEMTRNSRRNDVVPGQGQQPHKRDTKEHPIGPDGAVRPNPSLKRSTNGLPPGPVCGALHFPQPGPAGKPLSPA
ncbi:hypothetical protein RA210_U400002 [Rubrivivax sp. A210]|nr:hypothetical protein RA210_U400002 [Rubrivivax sp. A210]